jgi:hypothetical protein
MPDMALTPCEAATVLLLIAVLVLLVVVLADGGPRIGRGGLGSGGGYAVALLALLAPVPAPAQTGTETGAGLKSLSAEHRGSFWALPGALELNAGASRASMLSYRGASLPGSTELATTSAAPAGESRPSWGRGTEIGPRALASAPGDPQASRQAYSAPGDPIVPVAVRGR